MCGVLFTNDSKSTKKEFLAALNLMRHRGPDAEPGFAAFNANKLGHNRLKILDLRDDSNQPFYSSDKRFAVVYNGEIYNFREIAKEFNIKTRTTSDTEVLIELFVKLGPKMLELLNGMFAFIILDTITGSVFVARDRLGIKPLYYCTNGESITLASEIAAVVQLTGKTSFDEVGMRQYRKLRTFFNNRTPYHNISMFPAGHYMLDGQIKQYWQLPQGPQDPPADEEVRDLIESAVDYRCISDVPVGSYLSGGLDSTLIASLASKPHTWTIGFSECNEFNWAQIAAERKKSIHTEVLIENEEFVSLAEFMVAKRKEPLSVPNEVLLYKMTREVKTRNTVILSGEGADELFFGYDRIFRWANENDWDIAEFNRLYSYGTNDDLEIIEDALQPFMHYGKTIDIVAAFFQVAHLHGLLRRLDNATMLCSVEARVPFVDHRLVERMTGVPLDYRMEGNIVKAPLKRIFKDLIPTPIMNRVKIGFPVPLESMSFNDDSETPMDSWLNFNINQLNRSIVD